MNVINGGTPSTCCVCKRRSRERTTIQVEGHDFVLCYRCLNSIRKSSASSAYVLAALRGYVKPQEVAA